MIIRVFNIFVANSVLVVDTLKAIKITLIIFYLFIFFSLSNLEP